MYIDPNIDKLIFIQVAEQLEDSIFMGVLKKKQKFLQQMKNNT
jgi:DNA-binding transcriptional regulator YhcF (GntR family)